MAAPTAQRGMTLAISLILLAVLSLLATAGMQGSTLNLLMMSNVQSAKATKALGRDAVEQVISDIDHFNNPQKLVLNSDSDGDGYAVAAAPATCLREDPAPGYSAKWPLAPRDTTWEVVTDVEDTVTGSVATVHQGLRIRMTAGNCP